MSKSTTGRILRKLDGLGYVKLITFPGKYGTAIYLCNYLSTMFNISDVTIDKDEVALSLNIKITVPESACQNDEINLPASQISVPRKKFSVPKSHLVRIVEKTAKVLSLQGIACASCTHVRYILSNLSTSRGDCERKIISSELFIRCPDSGGSYRFTLEIIPQPNYAIFTESEVV